jgi:TolA-binding protein
MPAIAVALAACSAPATLSDLATAEDRERAGDVEGALAAYRAAQTSCRTLEPPRRARLACSQALLGEAELLEAEGRTAAAIERFAAIALVAEADAPTAAQGQYKAGVLTLATGEPARAWTYLWRAVTDFPDEAYAGDAVAVLLRDGRGRDAHALADELGRVLTPLGATGVADNLLWALADLTEHELADADTARAYYDRIPLDHPDSGLRDDARWHAARISRALGDAAGAAQRLEALLATREVARGAGSYFSIWLDDAQLELGRIQRDELARPADAERTFAALPRLYPASILRDDATYELARTRAARGDRPGACRAVADLGKRFPDSKYLAPAAELGCP